MIDMVPKAVMYTLVQYVTPIRNSHPNTCVY